MKASLPSKVCNNQPTSEGTAFPVINVVRNDRSAKLKSTEPCRVAGCTELSRQVFLEMEREEDENIYMLGYN